jgi:hypothetical protein
MTKQGKVIILGIVIIWAIIAAFMMFYPDNEIRVIPDRYEILYDRDTGECNVITRSENGLVSESLFSSTVVDECYQFTIKDD